jgi:SAM-dependent MidA family methyltransferase
MTACLHDPDFGYYATRPALGADGDFITAPLVSQMFGELIGLWAAECWDRLGRPPNVRLVEGGPGDGALMSDMLRAARTAPGFLEAIEVWLVEVSEPLKARQRERLGPGVRWAASVSELTPGPPVIFVGNELLDCLPARQFVGVGDRWLERKVGLDQAGALVFGVDPEPDPDLAIRMPPAAPGQVLEHSEAQASLGGALGRVLARDGGAALLIDYGGDDLMGDTLQALSRHRKVDPLACPGEADLTVHARFPLVLQGAGAQGATTAALITQGEFLRRLGIETRAQALAHARPDRADEIARQLERLTAPAQMGTLFKAACIHSPGWSPPGFEAAQ